ncbi:30S ribosomal protein S15 [Candidatus Woesearchaeota archaeon]|nr:30S ribosomal protein S15 [Candidatus Woesearchaeota archaeon]
MARMHSRKKGKSGSIKPIKKTKPTWVRYSETEVESLVVKLAKAGNNSAKIGLILRDSYGVPDVKIITKNKIGDILKNQKLSPAYPDDFTSLIKKEINIQKHLEKFKKDQVAKRGLKLTSSKINRLAKYYKRKGILPEDWRYDREKAKLIVS